MTIVEAGADPVDAFKQINNRPPGSRVPVPKDPPPAPMRTTSQTIQMTQHQCFGNPCANTVAMNMAAGLPFDKNEVNFHNLTFDEQMKFMEESRRQEEIQIQMAVVANLQEQKLTEELRIQYEVHLQLAMANSLHDQKSENSNLDRRQAEDH